MASNVSNFIIETTTKEYASLADVHDCEKNPGHEQFYSLADLNKNYMDILPELWLNYIRAWSKRIVKITVTKPDGTRLFGTGCVYKTGHDKFLIKTNEHVIGSQEDVRNCTIEFFYDTEDRAGVETSCGVELIRCDGHYDMCEFTVNTIPETVKQIYLQPIYKPPLTNLQHIIVISHPHGAPKTITIGKFLGSERVDGVYRSIHTAKTCPGASGTSLIYTGSLNFLGEKPVVDVYYRDIHNARTCPEASFTNLINASHVKRLGDWRFGNQYTHYAGRRGNVCNIKKSDGTVIEEVKSETNNINYSMHGGGVIAI